MMLCHQFAVSHRAIAIDHMTSVERQAQSDLADSNGLRSGESVLRGSELAFQPAGQQ